MVSPSMRGATTPETESWSTCGLAADDGSQHTTETRSTAESQSANRMARFVLQFPWCVSFRSCVITCFSFQSFFPLTRGL